MTQASAEKLEHTGPAEKKRVALVPQSSWQVRQNRLCQKEEEQSRLSRVPACKEEESHTLARKWKIRAGAWGGKVDSTMKEGMFQGGD